MPHQNNGYKMWFAYRSLDMDASVQPDGSLLATRIEVMDTATDNLTVSDGPLLYTSTAGPIMSSFGQEGWGPLHSGTQTFSFTNIVPFEISGQFSNLQDLPFPASFNSANMISGQKIFVTTHATNGSPQPIYVPAATVTLMPQSIDGTVAQVSSDGGFDTFTVTLAPYDLFPDLAVQGGQTTLLTNPNTVVVYADSNTQMLNTSPVEVGGVFRFYGLIFNDKGTLRMDCSRVNDGVAE